MALRSSARVFSLVLSRAGWFSRTFPDLPHLPCSFLLCCSVFVLWDRKCKTHLLYKRLLNGSKSSWLRIFSLLRCSCSSREQLPGGTKWLLSKERGQSVFSWMNNSVRRRRLRSEALLTSFPASNRVEPTIVPWCCRTGLIWCRSVLNVLKVNYQCL